MSQSVSTVAPVALSDTDNDGQPRNVLVNLTGTEIDRRLVREAGAYARHTGGRLVLLSIMPSREFAGRNEARLHAGCRRYTLGQAEAEGRRFAACAGREVCSSLGIEPIVVGTVGSEIDGVPAAVREHDCGHVFLTDRQPAKRTRLVGDDLVRTVMTGFDGSVTIV